MNRTCRVVRWCLLLLAGPAGLLCASQAQSKQQTSVPQVSPAATQKTPVMDGGVGPCSLDLTVTTADGNPVYAVTVKVHIRYGFLGLRRLDLEAGTNSDGKVRFIGLPSRVRRPPLTFQASNGQLVGTANYDPDQNCQAKHDLVLTQPKEPLGK